MIYDFFAFYFCFIGESPLILLNLRSLLVFKTTGDFVLFLCLLAQNLNLFFFFLYLECVSSFNCKKTVRQLGARFVSFVVRLTKCVFIFFPLLSYSRPSILVLRAKEPIPAPISCSSLYFCISCLQSPSFAVKHQTCLNLKRLSGYQMRLPRRLPSLSAVHLNPAVQPPHIPLAPWPLHPHNLLVKSTTTAAVTRRRKRRRGHIFFLVCQLGTERPKGLINVSMLSASSSCCCCCSSVVEMGDLERKSREGPLLLLLVVVVVVLKI